MPGLRGKPANTRNGWIIGIFCTVASAATALTSRAGLPDQVLMVFVVPVLLAAVLRQRYVYMSMLLFFSVCGFIITENYRLPITESTITLVAILISTVVACEAVHFVARRETRLMRIAAENEQRFRAFVENAADSIFVIDEDGVIVETNEAAVSTFGFAREALIGSRFDTLCRASQTKDSIEAQDKLLHANGKTIAVEMSTGQFEMRGRVTRIVIVRNTEDRVRAEARLRQAEIIRQSILESTPDYIMMLDLDYRVQFINRTTSDLSIEGLTGANITDYLSPDDRAKTVACYERVRATRETGFFETRYESNVNGDVVYFESRVAPIIEDGEVVGFTVSSSDVTERKRQVAERLAFERSMLESQKLESLGLLAGGVAHDFNNLLVAIMGRADLAQANTNDASMTQEHLQQILEASQHAAGLCQQLLAYSGKGRFVIAPTNLSTFLGETRKLLEISVPDNVRIDYELDASPHTLEADSTQLRQVIMNLISNACEALQPKGGEIVVRTGTETLDHAGRLRHINGDQIEDGLYAYLEVEDNGSGMSTETMERLFDPFYTTKADGTGLGMAAVIGIVRGHRGAMAVTSREHHGTTIRVMLPAQPTTLRKSRAANGSTIKRQSHGGTILIIDDEPAVRAVAKAILEREKFDVLTAESGRKAIEVVHERSDAIDAVILDMKMPDMNGEEVMAELRAVRPDLPILLSSGYSEIEMSERTEGKGVSGFLPKPYLAEDLIAAIQGVMSPTG